MRVENHSAADRECRRVATDDESIAAHRNDRRLQSNLHKCALSGFQFGRLVDEANASEKLVGEMVETNPSLLLERLRFREQIETRGDDLGRPQCGRREHLLPAMQLFEIDVREIHRCSLTGGGEFARLAVNLDRSRTAAKRVWKNLDFAVDVQSP